LIWKKKKRLLNLANKGLSKAWLFIIWMLTQLGIIGTLMWFDNFAYNGNHVEWDPYWVVPVQWAVFLILIGVQIVCVALLIFPKEWFVSWAESELDGMKKRNRS